MRFNADEAMRSGRTYKVTLDGVTLDYPVWANSETGEVRFAPCGKNGKPYFSRKLDDFITVTARGKVEIVPEPDLTVRTLYGVPGSPLEFSIGVTR